AIRALGALAPRRRRILGPGAAAVRRARETAQVGRPEAAVRAAREGQEILALDPPPGRRSARGADRVRSLGPARTPIPAELDAVRRGDIYRVAARDDAVRGAALP